MRTILGVTAVVALTGWAAGQPQPAPPEPRYGVNPLIEAYPQTTPQAALGSVLKAVDKGRWEYLTAQLLDPVFVDKRVGERATKLTPEVERELLADRDARRNGPAETRLPEDPTAFAEVVRREATQRAFRQFTQAVRATLAENPDHVKELRRFALNGAFSAGGEVAQATLPDVKDRAVYFRKVNDRWHVEDRQKPEPEKK
ncbi:MAG: hypothetical protein U0871_03785 [Gemmataceae bacterium]